MICYYNFILEKHQLELVIFEEMYDILNLDFNASFFNEMVLGYLKIYIHFLLKGLLSYK